MSHHQEQCRNLSSSDKQRMIKAAVPLAHADEPTETGASENDDEIESDNAAHKEDSESDSS